MFSINIVSQVTSVHSITGVHWSWSRYWSLTLWDSRAWGLCPWPRWSGTWPGYHPCSGATLARGDNTVQAAQVGSTSLYRINNLWINFFYSWEYVMFLSQLPGHPLHQEWFIQTKIQVWIFSTKRFISGFITNTKIIQEDISQQLLWYSGHLHSQHPKWGLYHLPAKFSYTDADASFYSFLLDLWKLHFFDSELYKKSSDSRECGGWGSGEVWNFPRKKVKKNPVLDFPIQIFIQWKCRIF